MLEPRRDEWSRLWPEEGKTQFSGLPLGAAKEVGSREILEHSVEDLPRLKGEGAI